MSLAFGKSVGSPGKGGAEYHVASIRSNAIARCSMRPESTSIGRDSKPPRGVRSALDVVAASNV